MPSSVRILYLTEESISFSSALVRGGAIHVRNVVEGLRNRGHGVHLVDWNRNPERPYQDSVSPRTRFVDGPSRSFARAVTVGRAESVDVVISKTRKTYLPGLTAARVLGVPHVVHVGSLLTPNGNGWLERLDAGSLSARLRAPHDRYFVVCKAIQDQLLERGVAVNRIHAVKNAVDADRFRPGTGVPPQNLPEELPDGPLVGFVGGLHDYKGVYDLTVAIERAETQPALLVAGDGPEGEMMAERLGERGIFLGGVPYERMPGVYDAIDVLALPSHTEGLPRVVLEAAAMGTPVVATRVGGIPELISDGETGLLCPPRNPDQFATALDRVLGDEGLQQSLASAARALVTEEYSWERMYDRYEAGLDHSV